MKEKISECKLCQAVLKIKASTRLERVADVIRGGESTGNSRKKRWPPQG